MGVSSPAKLSRKKDAISSAEGLLSNSHLQMSSSFSLSSWRQQDNATCADGRQMSFNVLIPTYLVGFGSQDGR